MPAPLQLIMRAAKSPRACLRSLPAAALCRHALVLMAGFALAGCGGTSADAIGGTIGRLPTPVLPASVDVPAPSHSDGQNYRTQEFLNTGNTGRTSYFINGRSVTVRGLQGVGAEHAYQRGYFGQGVTVAIVDSGFDRFHANLSVNMLSGINIDDRSSPLPRVHGHGTTVAAVLAAPRGDGGAHGIAPRAKMMPYHVSVAENELHAFRHAAAANIPIVNNSWVYQFNVFGELAQSGGATLTMELDLPVSPSLLRHSACVGCQRYINVLFGEYERAVHNQDIVLVFGAGNERFNSDPTYGQIKGCRLERSFSGTFRTTDDCIDYRTQEVLDRFTILPLDVVEHDNAFSEAIQIATLDIGLNAIGVPAAAPSFRPSLLGRWVVVTGLWPDRKPLFNGCGIAMHYCMAAPGMIRSVDGRLAAGTSIAAPLVSGALAVLRSRLPDMPMYALLAILFDTAEDLGAPGTDEVYGRGFLNLNAATAKQGEVAIVLGQNARSRRIAASSLRLSPALRSLAEHAQKLSVAVNYLGGYYYNMPLAGLFKQQPTAQAKLGAAASDMLAGPAETSLGAGFAAVAHYASGELDYISHTGPHWRLDYKHCSRCASSVWETHVGSRTAAPFFASGGKAAKGEIELGAGWSAFGAAGFEKQDEGVPYRQAGLRWETEASAEGSWAGSLELSRIVEDDALLGGVFNGALAVGDSTTHQAHLSGELALDESWRLTGSYTAGWTEAETVDGSIIKEIGGIRFAGWQSHLEGRSLLSTGDALRIGLKRQTSVEKGHMLIEHGIVEGNPTFSEEHHLNLNSNYRLAASRIDFGHAGALVAQLGYAFSHMTGVRAAAGLEYATDGGQEDDYAASFELRWEL